MNKKMGNILLVDDTPENLRFLSAALKSEGYTVRVALSGKMALSMANADLPDLVLLDIDMPEMNGYQVCDYFKSNIKLKSIPIIFLSALQDTEAKVLAFQHGGVDYSTKPFRLEELLARISTHLELHRLKQELESHNQALSKMVMDQFREIYAAQLSTIMALAKLSESRDDDTGMHIERVGSYATFLAREARKTIEYDCEIDDQFEEYLYHAAALHDIGKVGISDCVLLKPGKLTPEEFEIIKKHPEIGYETLRAVGEKYPGNPMIKIGEEVAHCHHEKWNGSGYPQGLKGEQIPLSARIVAICDVYDALRSVRPYKKPFSHQKAYDFIIEGAGQHFDPNLIEIFKVSHESFNEIWNRQQEKD